MKKIFYDHIYAKILVFGKKFYNFIVQAARENRDAQASCQAIGQLDGNNTLENEYYDDVVVRRGGQQIQVSTAHINIPEVSYCTFGVSLVVNRKVISSKS